ncbi:ABC transporter substrate-binding protein [Streptomyces sp. GQFP]|uniref:ABC transporter substrate-binding protein n=1 Tax=Streptomyces sp. GQFP TaxID=2907545 RepID=UPI001F364B2A|nr:ABC transporter substrate-binding protein [Streptomyces sp. GQFP]UIX29130.1 ABC transporter substrate-binding protein [Streptomyces sp. GQFP]
MPATRPTPTFTSTSSPSSRRRVLTSLGALALGAATAGCGTSQTSADGTVTLNFQWWGGDDRNIATDKALRLFERRHPKIKVTTSFSGYQAYFQRLATQVAANSGPDVLQMDYYELRSYAANGLVANLDGPEFSGVSLGRIPRTYVNGNRLGGKLYAVPTGISTQALFVDPAIWRKAGVGLPKAGWTWDDLLDEVGPALKRAAPDRAVITDFGGYSETFNVWLVQHGKSIYKSDGSLGFTVADLTTFWELTARLRDKGFFTPPNVTASYDGSTDSSPLVRKLSTAEFNITSTATPYFEAYGDVAAIPFPTLSSGAPLGLTAGAGAMCVQQRCAHKREAALLLDFLLNDPAAGGILGVVRGLPPNRGVMDRLASSLTGGDRVVYEYVAGLEKRFALAPIPPSGSNEDKLEFRRVYEDLLFGKQSIRSAATKMVDKYHTTVPQG